MTIANASRQQEIVKSVDKQNTMTRSVASLTRERCLHPNPSPNMTSRSQKHASRLATGACHVAPYCTIP